MARNPRREANLERIAKKQRAAGQKVSKNERQGVPVRASGFDPRRPMAEVRAMSGRELRAYERRLDTFTSRRTQFTGLNFGGAAVPRSTWNTYRRLEARYNAITAAREAPILGIRLPGSDGGRQDMTIGQRLGIGPNRENIPQANASYRVFQQIQRDPRFITGPKKLDRLIEQMKEKIRPGYLDTAIKPKLNSLYAILQGSDNADFISRVAGLNAEQQNLLIDYSTFVTIAEDRFYPDSAEQQQMDADFFARTGMSRSQDIHDQLERVLQWVINEVYPASRGEAVPYVERSTAGAVPVQRGRGGRAGREFTDTNAGPIPTQGSVERSPAGPIPIQQDRFSGHHVGDFIMSERSGSVWQVEARNRAAGTLRVRNIENGRAREVKPSNYIGISEHNRRTGQ